MSELLFRIEDGTGRGPYRGVVETNHFSDPEVNPTLAFDRAKDKPGKTLVDVARFPGFGTPPLFAFNSPAQMRAWFNDYAAIQKERWAAHGLRIAVYPRADADKVFEGEHQVVFNFGRPPHGVTLPLSELESTPDDVMIQEAETALITYYGKKVLTKKAA